MDGRCPPPPRWRLGERFDGKKFAGTSLHAPATEENATALRELRRGRETFRMSEFAGLIIKSHQIREGTANIDCDDEHGLFRLIRLKEAALLSAIRGLATGQVAT